MRTAMMALGCGIVLSMTAPARAQTDVPPATRVASQAPSSADPRPAPRLVHGRRGQWLVGGTSHMTIGGGHFAHRSLLSVLPENVFGFAFVPSVGYFVANYVSVGLLGDFEVTRAPGTTAWSVAIGPEARAYVPLGRRVGLLPGLALLYKRADADDTLSLVFKIPAAVHLNEYVSLALGPQVSQDVWRHRASLRSTGYGLHFGIVGWL